MNRLSTRLSRGTCGAMYVRGMSWWVAGVKGKGGEAGIGGGELAAPRA